jgi:membrane-associated phospholipid phosphatase
VTEVQTEQRRPAIARNLAAFRRRLLRHRVPDPQAGARGRMVIAGAALTAALIVLCLVTIDLHSVGWWEGLSKSERRAFDWVTRFGKSDWLLIPTGVFCVALLFADWNRTARRVAAAWIEVGNLAAFFFFTIAFAGIITNLIKWTIGRSRPILFAEDGAFALNFLSFDYEHVSFPSGHATTAAAAFTAIVLIFRRRWVLITIIGVAAAAIALSRIGVRAHFPSDVVAGLFVGSAFTYLYAHALGRHGVAFQRQPDGSVRPKTVAVRRVLAQPGGAGAMVRGLRAAWFGRPTAAVAVEKP